MIDVSYEFEYHEKPSVLMEYLSNPENWVKYFKPAKKLEKIGPDEWILYLHWFKTVKSKLTRVISNNESEFIINSLGWPKFKMALKTYILPAGNVTKVRLEFIYDGPLEGTSKKEMEEAYKTLAISLGADIKKYCEENKCYDKKEVDHSEKIVDTVSLKGLKIYEMRTLLKKEIKKSELDEILEKALAYSIDKDVVVIIEDGNEIVKFHFSNGDLVEKEGNLDSLGDTLKVLVKST
ncbi:SRPBCC family protein [Acidianus infernus]|uniref:SRPBCC family protein n=1 Tax=Acidianus infernus TaxID=12915 RepID=UPI003593A8C8